MQIVKPLIKAVLEKMKEGKMGKENEFQLKHGKNCRWRFTIALNSRRVNLEIRDLDTYVAKGMVVTALPRLGI